MTGMPKQSSSSKTTSPALIPIRTWSGVAPERVVPPDRLLDGHRRPHRLGGPPEGGHDPVAEVFDLVPAVRLDGVGHQGVVFVAQLLRRVLTQPRAQLSRSDEIGEQDDGG